VSQVPYVHVDHELVAGTLGEPLALTAAESHHLRRVLRLADGAAVEVSDGCGHEAPARLEAAGLVLTAPASARPAPQPELWLAQALPKGRRFDEVVRQVTELGVDGIVAVAAKRSVTRIDEDRAERARQRWDAVARAACEQARRPWRPTIRGPVAPARLTEEPQRLLVAHPGATPLPDALVGHEVTDGLMLAIGPEGGWADDEIAELCAAGASLVGLGPSVLRTEHAAAAACAVAAAGLGRWADAAPGRA
jgi:16S rRNA (uracil1498-N3)-methyltransferase